MNERFIGANELLRDSFQLAANIYEAGFKPDFLVGLWRGGSAVGIAVQYLLENLCSDHSMLIVDDVYSTGSSVNAVISQLARKTRRNLPRDIRIGTVWYRPSEKTLRTPDYFVHETSDWLVLPYELSGFSIQELKENRPEMAGLLERLAPYVKSEDDLPVG